MIKDKLKKIISDRYLLALIAIIIMFLVFTNLRINQTQGWDESRHAVQGHIFYDYYHTLLSGDWLSFRTFMEQYQEQGYNAGWFMIDPPFHAKVMGLIFLFVGATPVTAALATELLIILGAVLLYLLSLKILEKKFLALSVVILYLFSAALVNIGGLAMLEIPISFMMVGWYYFTFLREGKTLNLRFSSKIGLHLKLNTLWGALFLTAATLMKYQTIIYAAAFYLLAIIYYWWTEKKWPGELFKTGFIQGLIFLVLGFWWIKFSLFDYGFLQKLFDLSIGYQEPQWFSPSYTFAYLINTVKETTYLALLALIPIIVWFIKKKDSFLSRNKQLFLLILAIYLAATILISSRHFRYAIQVLPFVFILMVQGLDELSNWIQNKIKSKPFPYLFIILMILLTAVSAYASYGLMSEQIEKRGVYSYELSDYLAEITGPRLVLNVDADLEEGRSYYSDGTAYYYNQDLFIFETMMANDRQGFHNPKKMDQIVQLAPAKALTDYDDFAGQLQQLSSQMKIVVVLFKKSNPNFIDLDKFEAALQEQGFEKTELQWYYVYELE